MRKVMVFGVFDGLHDGHRHFLREARREGDWVVAVVAPDAAVYELKGRAPELHEGDRVEFLRGAELADETVLGDAEPGAWRVVREHRPEVIVLGYDQEALGEALGRDLGKFPWEVRLARADAHQPATHHSRLLRRGRRS